MGKYTYALLCAVGFGIGPVLARYGAVHGVPAVVGTTIGYACALPCMYLLVLARGKPLTYRTWPRRTQLFVFAAGVGSALGVMIYWIALSYAPVAVVVSINASFPVITIALSYVFLRQDERITLRLIAGAIFVIGGVLTITL